MDYFSFMIRKEIILTKIINLFCNIINIFKLKQNRQVNKSLKEFQAKKNSNKAVVVLNAPSINKQNLFLLKDMDIAFVNRGFMHKQYQKIHPKYHIICDPKFIKGIWPISWIDDIVAMVPDITIVFPIEWKKTALMQELINKNIKICWIRIKDKPFTPFVAGYAIQFLINLKYESIFFTGCEANGLGHELIKDTSHFYGINQENELKGSKEYIIDFYMYMLNYEYFRIISRKMKHKNIKIINLTIGGCLDMFERQSFLNMKD